MNKLIALIIPFYATSLLYAQNNVGSSTTEAPAKEIPWVTTFKSEMYNSNLENARKVGGAMTDNQFRIAYKINDKVQLGLLLGAKYKVASEKEIQSDQNFVNSDAAIAGFLTAPTILGADKTEIDARFYLPTSDLSKSNNQNYLIRADVKLPYSFDGDRKSAIIFSPRFTDNKKTVEQLEVLTQARIGQGKTFLPYVALNHRIKMLGQTSNMSRTEEYMGPELGLEMFPHKLVKLAALIAQERNILNPSAKKVRHSYSPFSREETKYLLGAQIKL